MADIAMTAQDLDRVGMHLAQGYHFGRPLPVEEFTAALQGENVDRGRRHGSVAVPGPYPLPAKNRSAPASDRSRV